MLRGPIDSCCKAQSCRCSRLCAAATGCHTSSTHRQLTASPLLLLPPMPQCITQATFGCASNSQCCADLKCEKVNATVAIGSCRTVSGALAPWAPLVPAMLSQQQKGTFVPAAPHLVAHYIHSRRISGPQVVCCVPTAFQMLRAVHQPEPAGLRRGSRLLRHAPLPEGHGQRSIGQLPAGERMPQHAFEHQPTLDVFAMLLHKYAR